MARQEIILGAAWDSIFEKLNANFKELFDAQGDAVTSEQLTQALTSYVTSAALVQALAGYTTTEELETALNDVVKNSELTSYVTNAALTQQLASYITATALDNKLADYVTSTGLTQQLTSYVTNAALTQQLANYITATALDNKLANKVDKIAGKDLSTNDYTTAEKNKLAGLKAPTKIEFTASNWSAADSNGIYSYTIQSAQTVANVFRANGSAFENAAVAISVSGENITLKSEETFAGFAILV